MKNLCFVLLLTLCGCAGNITTQSTESYALTERHIEVRNMFKKLITAYGQKDFDTFATYFSDETIFEWPYKPVEVFPEVMVGIDKFLAVSRAGMKDTKPYGHTVDKFYDLLDPNMLIVEYHTNTRLLNADKRYANKYIGIVRFEGSKVTFWKEYINPTIVRDTFGRGNAAEDVQRMKEIMGEG